jgi:hypothetical protein
MDHALRDAALEGSRLSPHGGEPERLRIGDLNVMITPRGPDASRGERRERGMP